MLQDWNAFIVTPSICEFTTLAHECAIDPLRRVPSWWTVRHYASSVASGTMCPISAAGGIVLTSQLPVEWSKLVNYEHSPLSYGRVSGGKSLADSLQS